MTSLQISLTFINSPHSPTLPTGVHHIAEIMPHVPTCHGLSSENASNPM
jgi:hypothetical protein